MEMEHYISQLLYRYNCVVVPHFGAFLAHKVSARIHKPSNTFHAPTKALAFNGQLTSNDGLLVSQIAGAEGVPYEKALEQIDEAVKGWKKTLDKGERLHVAQLGALWYNDEGKVQFEPAKEVNYLIGSFGLQSVHSLPVVRETLKKEIAALEEKIPFVITPETRQKGSFRPYLKYAAILLLAFATGLTGYRLYIENQNTLQLVEQQAEEVVDKQIQVATFFNAQPLELPPVTIDAVTPKGKPKAAARAKHHIIAGAFRFKANAEKKIRQLKRLGFPAQYYGTNAHGLHVVSYDRFTDAQEALRTLHGIRRSQSADAWLLSEK